MLPLDGATSWVWARRMHRRSDAPYEDAMIAATALVHRLVVVARNVGVFTTFEVRTLDPFAGR